jgi:hypothetical protein
MYFSKSGLAGEGAKTKNGRRTAKWQRGWYREEAAREKPVILSAAKDLVGM